MRGFFISILLMIVTYFTWAQSSKDTVHLSNWPLCNIPFAQLSELDTSFTKVTFTELNSCPDIAFNPGRFVLKTGIQSPHYPGVIIQKQRYGEGFVSKFHLNAQFKGTLPNGDYVDLSQLKAQVILQRYSGDERFTTHSCNDYWILNYDNQYYYYVAFDKNKTPKYPVDRAYYAQQPIIAIDIVQDCGLSDEQESQKNSLLPYLVIDGQPTCSNMIRFILDKDIEEWKVLQPEDAKAKYGDVAQQGAIEIVIKKEQKKKYQKLIQEKCVSPSEK